MLLCFGHFRAWFLVFACLCYYFTISAGMACAVWYFVWHLQIKRTELHYTYKYIHTYIALNNITIHINTVQIRPGRFRQSLTSFTHSSMVLGQSMMISHETSHISWDPQAFFRNQLQLSKCKQLMRSNLFHRSLGWCRSNDMRGRFGCD